MTTSDSAFLPSESKDNCSFCSNTSLAQQRSQQTTLSAAGNRGLTLRQLLITNLSLPCFHIFLSFSSPPLLSIHLFIWPHSLASFLCIPLYPSMFLHKSKLVQCHQRHTNRHPEYSLPPYHRHCDCFRGNILVFTFQHRESAEYNLPLCLPLSYPCLSISILAKQNQNVIYIFNAICVCERERKQTHAAHTHT